MQKPKDNGSGDSALDDETTTTTKPMEPTIREEGDHEIKTKSSTSFSKSQQPDSDSDDKNDDKDNDSVKKTRPPAPVVQELHTSEVKLDLQSKHIYIDVKENERGRYLKLVEVRPGKLKSRVLMSTDTGVKLSECLHKLMITNAKLGKKKKGPPVSSKNNETKSLERLTLNQDNRKYVIELSANRRGRVVKISHGRSASRRASGALPAIVVIPVNDMDKVLGALNEVLVKWGPANIKLKPVPQMPLDKKDKRSKIAAPKDNGSLPKAKTFGSHMKRYYFDFGKNNRGAFMRVSEVTQSVRSFLTVPKRYWYEMRDVLIDVCDEADDGESDDAGEQDTITATDDEKVAGCDMATAPESAFDERKQPAAEPDQSIDDVEAASSDDETDKPTVDATAA